MSETMTRNDIALIVAGEDCAGNATPRILSADRVVVLRGEFGKGFELGGPHAAMCRECGVPLFAEASHGVIRALQRHYGQAHGSTPALLA